MARKGSFGGGVRRRQRCSIKRSLPSRTFARRDLMESMMRKILFVVVLAVSFIVPGITFASDDDPLFHSINPLAPRDDWGRLHQMPNVDQTDYFPRWGSRLYYYAKSRQELLRD